METVNTDPGKSALNSKQDDGAFRGSTEAEIKKISVMRILVEAKDHSKEIDDLMIRRFLRACDLDVEKASAMFLKYLKWKHSFVPYGYVSSSEIVDDLAQEKVYVQGADKKGRPIVVTFAAKHFQNKNGLEALNRYLVFVLEKLCSRMAPGVESFLSITDIKGWGYANSDLRGYVSALNILQDYYPERLGKLFIVHAPYMFMKVWKLVYPFIDDNTKKKIVFVEKKKLKSILLEEIDESQLPEIYGGKLQLVPIQDS